MMDLDGQRVCAASRPSFASTVIIEELGMQCPACHKVCHEHGKLLKLSMRTQPAITGYLNKSVAAQCHERV